MRAVFTAYAKPVFGLFPPLLFSYILFHVSFSVTTFIIPYFLTYEAVDTLYSCQLALLFLFVYVNLNLSYCTALWMPLFRPLKCLSESLRTY